MEPRIVLVANQPYPYRNQVYDLIPNFTAVYSCKCELNRNWDNEPNHEHIYLKKFYIPYGQEFYAHLNIDIFSTLKKLKPDVVIIYGFSPTQQLTYLWCKLTGTKYVLMAESWAKWEESRTKRQLNIQRRLIKDSSAIIAASKKGEIYFQSFGGKNIFISHLVENKIKTDEQRTYDFIYASQMIERKCPMFILSLMKSLPHRKLLVAGSGPMVEELTYGLLNENIDFDYVGAKQFSEMQKLFAQSKICLFPTKADTWGLVANEAMMQGTPVITTPYAGCAQELVVDCSNGFVIDLSVELWASRAELLLKDKYLWEIFSRNAQKMVSDYTPIKSAEQIIRACEYAMD